MAKTSVSAGVRPVAVEAAGEAVGAEEDTEESRLPVARGDGLRG
jgi:hypothetical protein